MALNTVKSSGMRAMLGMPQKKKHLVVAMDHGLSFSDIEGLERPVRTLERLASNPLVDGVIASPGVFMQADRHGMDISRLFRILTVDFVALENADGGTLLSHREIIITPEEADYLKPDAYKMFLNIYEDKTELIRNAQDMERFVAHGAGCGASVLAEVLFFGNAAFSDPLTQGTELVKGCRLAMELGADILKIPMVEHLETVAEIVDRFKLPVFILGGSKYSDDSLFLNDIARLAPLPVSGVMLGRNVWQSDDMDGMISSISAALR